MSYSLTKICDTTAASIETGWYPQLDALGEEGEALASSVERIIDWCLKATSDTTDEAPCLWSLHEEGTEAPRAIVEMTDARRSKDPSFKFLNIYPEPRLILDYKDEIHKADLSEVVMVISFALTESLKQALVNGVNKLKIYGRTDEMRSMFDSMILTINDDSNVDLYRQGKWLVIEQIR